MPQLTPSGEVAVFTDDNQFGTGQSVDKCGPEAVSIIWHAVKPGLAQSYTSAEIHAMASADYQKYIGPDTSSDTGGTSNEILYEMLAEHGFHYEAGPVEMSWVKQQLALGLPVIIGIVESSVHDNEVGGVPYAWNTAGLTHIIVASGQGNSGEILVRDTANIAPNGVRPGPRHYDANKLQLISATSVTPSWLEQPAPPPPEQPAPPPEKTWISGSQAQQADDYWGSTTAHAASGNRGTGGIFPEGQTPNASTGIAKAWQTEYMNGRNWGPPISYEFASVDWDGNAIVAQMFAGGRCEWRDGSGKWYSWQ